MMISRPDHMAKNGQIGDKVIGADVVRRGQGIPQTYLRKVYSIDRKGQC